VVQATLGIPRARVLLLAPALNALRVELAKYSTSFLLGLLLSAIAFGVG
jgi:hypothetical protein